MTIDLRKDHAIAPLWHTGFLVALIVAVAVTGTLLFAHRELTVVRAPIDAPVVAVACGLSAYVCLYARSRRALTTLLCNVRLGDLVIACALYAFVRLTYVSVAPLPLIVAAAVGISEELVYRGYLQAQFAVLTRRTSVAIVLQAILFGVAHANQGARHALLIGAYGLLFGVVTSWRRSLVAVVLCHVAIDGLHLA